MLSSFNILNTLTLPLSQKFDISLILVSLYYKSCFLSLEVFRNYLLFLIVSHFITMYLNVGLFLSLWHSNSIYNLRSSSLLLQQEIICSRNFDFSHFHDLYYIMAFLCLFSIYFLGILLYFTFLYPFLIFAGRIP